MDDDIPQSELKYQTLQDNLPQRIAHKDRNSVYVSCNMSFAQEFGIEPAEIAGKTDYYFFPKDRADKYVADDRKVMDLGQTQETERKYFLDGQPRNVKMIKTPVRNEKGETVGLICIFGDVTGDSKDGQTSRLPGSIAQSSDEAVIRESVEGIILSWNRGAESIYGYSAKEMVGKSIAGLIPPGRREERSKMMEALGRGEQIESFETQSVKKGGQSIPMSITISALKDSGGKTVGIITYGREITESRRAGEQLQKAGRDLAVNLDRIVEIALATPGEDMYAHVLDAILEVTRSERGAFGYIVEGAAARMGMSSIGGPRRLPGKSMRFVREQQAGYSGQALSEKRLVYSNRALNVSEGDLPIQRVMVAPLLDRDEVIGYLEIANKTTDYDESDKEFLEGAAKSLVPILRERARREVQAGALSAALAAKEVLLQEVHHRVKNNLQIISSLLNLQAESLPAVAQKALDESQRRVRSMALIHEQLYTNGDVGRLNFGEYAQCLCTELLGAYGATPNLVRLRFDLDPVTLDMDEATPCGLILNEVVTNSLKYAFPDSRSGEILVALHCGSGNVVTLRVADDGIGMQPGFHWQESKSLGLRIVDILARQLDGNLRQEPGKGTDFTLTFVRHAG